MGSKDSLATPVAQANGVKTGCPDFRECLDKRAREATRGRQVGNLFENNSIIFNFINF
jgi:hypothetical protein